MKNEFLTKPHDWTRVKRTSETRSSSSEQRAAAGAWLIVDIASAVGLVTLLAWVLLQWGN